MRDSAKRQDRDLLEATGEGLIFNRREQFFVMSPAECGCASDLRVAIASSREVRGAPRPVGR